MKPHGLVFTHFGKLGYGWKHGFGCGWIPESWQRGFVKVWNLVACFLLGHNRYQIEASDGFEALDFCASCCKDWLK